MNFNLTRQFLAGFGPDEVCLWHDFEGPGLGLVLHCLDWFDSSDLVALGEATFAQESATLVCHSLSWLIVVLWADWLYFLLNDLFIRRH